MAFIDCINDDGDLEGIRLGALHAEISTITKNGKSEKWKEAKRFLEDYTIYLLGRNPEWSKEVADQVARDDVGYLSGYSDLQTAEEIQKVFDVEHPILSRIKELPDRKVIDPHRLYDELFGS